ncbi:hypothetical protein HK097_002038, partial [Rhizophlyctis rosea]
IVRRGSVGKEVEREREKTVEDLVPEPWTPVEGKGPFSDPVNERELSKRLKSQESPLPTPSTIFSTIAILWLATYSSIRIVCNPEPISPALASYQPVCQESILPAWNMVGEEWEKGVEKVVRGVLPGVVKGVDRVARKVRAVVGVRPPDMPVGFKEGSWKGENAPRMTTTATISSEVPTASSFSSEVPAPTQHQQREVDSAGQQVTVDEPVVRRNWQSGRVESDGGQAVEEPYEVVPPVASDAPREEYYSGPEGRQNDYSQQEQQGYEEQQHPPIEDAQQPVIDRAEPVLEEVSQTGQHPIPPYNESVQESPVHVTEEKTVESSVVVESPVSTMASIFEETLDESTHGVMEGKEEEVVPETVYSGADESGSGPAAPVPEEQVSHVGVVFTPAPEVEPVVEVVSEGVVNLGEESGKGLDEAAAALMESSSVASPVAESSVAETSVAESSVAEQPVAEQSVAENPITESPITPSSVPSSSSTHTATEESSAPTPEPLQGFGPPDHIVEYIPPGQQPVELEDTVEEVGEPMIVVPGGDVPVVRVPQEEGGKGEALKAAEERLEVLKGMFGGEENGSLSAESSSVVTEVPTTIAVVAPESALPEAKTVVKSWVAEPEEVDGDRQGQGQQGEVKEQVVGQHDDGVVQQKGGV